MSPSPVEPLGAAEIRRTREATKVSQAAFACLLNTSVSTVQTWEIGQEAADRLLNLLRTVEKRGIDVAL